MLQHVDDLGQLGVTPGKLPEGGNREGKLSEGFISHSPPSTSQLSFSLCHSAGERLHFLSAEGFVIHDISLTLSIVSIK